MYLFNGLGRDIRYVIDDLRYIPEAFYLIEDVCAALNITRREVNKHLRWGEIQGFYYIDKDDEQVKTDIISQQALDRLIAASSHPRAKAYLSWLEQGGDDTQKRRKMRRRRHRKQPW